MKKRAKPRIVYITDVCYRCQISGFNRKICIALMLGKIAIQVYVNKGFLIFDSFI